MACEGIHDRLGAFLDGELPPGEVARVRAHVAACAACAAELGELRRLAERIRPGDAIELPAELWPSIEDRLCAQEARSRRAARWFRFPIGIRLAAAAAIVLMVGAIALGLFARPTASASEINFSVLLDELSLDVDAAFKRFVELHSGRRSTAEQARRFGSSLNFAIPSELSGGFRLKEVYLLRIGSQPAVAARYDRQGEFLAAIFHPPVQKEDFGSHKDYECVVGPHRGHAVSVDRWTMVHVTDATTCHCVLSRLGHAELAPILRAVAPDLGETANHAHDDGSGHP